MKNQRKLTLLLLIGFLAGSSPVQSFGTPHPVAAPAKEFLKVDEALKLAFPGSTIKRGTVYLTEAQKKKASKLAKAKLSLGIVHPYEAFDEQGKLVGTAYFDTHQVRAKKESLMIVVSPSGTISRIEVCAFGEPVDYLPSGRWFAQFVGKRLNDDLNLKRDIRGITGATLSGEATTRCARRILALHEAIKPAPPKPKPTEKDKGRDA